MSVITEWFNYCLAIFKSITIPDIIDILFVTILIYGCIKIIITTRTYFILKGIAFTIIIYEIAKLLKLEMTINIFDKFFQVAVIVCIVLFQQEIRHGFEHFGKRKFNFLNLFNFEKIDEKNHETLNMINSVADSCSYLQKMKMGALIVIEKDIDLINIIETGTKIKCKPSPEMLGNIFFNKAPLHDGAVIIKNNEIYAAGCILPLTKNMDISSSLGTRHRAGIGMSENSDAIVIIVSEETGIISIAENGKLKQNYTKEKLINYLSKKLIINKDNTDKKTRGKKNGNRNEKKD